MSILNNNYLLSEINMKNVFKSFHYNIKNKKINIVIDSIAIPSQLS